MKTYVRVVPFALLIVGTLGLLANEIIFDWGSPATLTFAAINVGGLAILAFAYWGTKQGA